jgi:hypothetical protein
MCFWKNLQIRDKYFSLFFSPKKLRRTHGEERFRRDRQSITQLQGAVILSRDKSAFCKCNLFMGGLAKDLIYEVLRL